MTKFIKLNIFISEDRWVSLISWSEGTLPPCVKKHSYAMGEHITLVWKINSEVVEYWQETQWR